jgi:hypothetical protein
MIAALLTGCSDDEQAIIDTLTIEPLTATEIEDLQFLREEEKLALDVYTHAYNFLRSERIYQHRL